jgi:hypothetical protein
MNIPEKYLDKDLYKKAKKWADETYKVNSAYKSLGMIKKYKELNGRINESKTINNNLKRWLDEEWMAYIGNGKFMKCGSSNSKGELCRPTIIINKSTPLTWQELDLSIYELEDLLKKKKKGNRITWNVYKK